jgi:hypothetical protein
MVIIYDCELTEPPSSIHCFRDVTLYSNVFLGYTNLIKCPEGKRSIYWDWIKKYGAHDFVSQLITQKERQEGIMVGRNGLIKIEFINESNYGLLINKLKTI